MTLRIDDLIISAELPEMRSEMPVFTVRGVTLEERRPAIELLARSLDLGKMSVLEADGSLHFFSQAGEVQFYQPSGALWARNTAVDATYDSEVRRWKTKEVADLDDESSKKLILPESESRELAEQSQAILEKAGLLSRHAFFAGVELDQVAELDEEGAQVAQFAGEATVRFLYQLEDVPVGGAGAKSYVYFDPGENGPALVGAFHAWREIDDARAVQMPSLRAALDVSLTKDPELVQYRERGHDIELGTIDLVYYTRPAFAYQTLVFPALRVLGSVYERTEKGKRGFEFARFFHATPPESYARAGLYADYLAKPL